MVCWILILFSFLFTACPACADELSALAGLSKDGVTHLVSYGWQIEYMKGWSEHFETSLAYLNEGHATVNHRDGALVQLWERTSLADERVILAAGIGPYYYFNTLSDQSPVLNRHSWGSIMSFDLAYRTGGPWSYRLRTNWVATRDKSDTVSAFLGTSYEFDTPQLREHSAGEIPAKGEDRKNGLSVLAGETIVNNPDRGGHSSATNIEYRRSLSRHLDWTVGWLCENNDSLIQRYGTITQLWLANSFLRDRATVGAGIGPYLAVDHKRPAPDNDKVFVSRIATLTTSFRFLESWDARFSWSRVITDYNRDADLILSGIGFRF